MKRRIIALLMAATMTLGMLSACGSATEEQQTTLQEEKLQKEESQKKGELPVVRVAYNIMFSATDEQEVEDAVNEIMREKAGAVIDLVGVEFGNIQTQYNLMLTGGENTVDLFNSFWYTSESNLVSNGQVIELDELLETNGQDILEVYDGLEEYLDCGRISGKLYGIPCVYAWITENLYEVIAEDAQSAGIDWSKIHNLDDVTEAMIAMKEVNPDKYFIPGSTDPYWVPKDIDYLGDTNYLGVLTDPTNSTTVENYYESEYFINFLEHVKIWKEHNLFSPDPLSNNNPVLLNILSGVADGTLGYNWDTDAGIRSTAFTNNLNIEGTAITEALATTGEVTTYMWHISSFCKDPDAAMRVLNVMYSDPEVSQLLANGIEGKDYLMDENGQMVYPNEQGLSGIGWMAASMAFWPNVMILEKTWSSDDPDLYEKMVEKRANAKKSLALGFQFESTPVADQMTACANVVAQYYNPLMYGETDIDEALPQFQKELKAAGIDDIIAEKQRQLDEWLASK